MRLRSMLKRSGSAAARQPVRLNLGSGPVAVAGWVNADKSLVALLDGVPLIKRTLADAGILSPAQAAVTWDRSIVRVDLTRRFPWPDGSVEAIYSSHFLEHMPPEVAQRLLERCHRALAPGALIRICLPNLEAGAREYLKARDEGEEGAADRFLDFLYLSPQPHGNALRRTAVRLLHRPHGWMYDVDSCALRLREAGFVDITQRAMGEGECPDVKLLDQRAESFFLEACKPA